MARARSALRALTRCDCLSVANASSRSELSNGATRSSTAGKSAQPTAEPKLRGLPQRRLRRHRTLAAKSGP